MPRTKLAVRVAGAEFGIAGQMRRLPAYFDNPVSNVTTHINILVFERIIVNWWIFFW